MKRRQISWNDSYAALTKKPQGGVPAVQTLWQYSILPFIEQRISRFDYNGAVSQGIAGHSSTLFREFHRLPVLPDSIQVQLMN